MEIIVRGTLVYANNYCILKRSLRRNYFFQTGTSPRGKLRVSTPFYLLTPPVSMAVRWPTPAPADLVIRQRSASTRTSASGHHCQPALSQSHWQFIAQRQRPSSSVSAWSAAIVASQRPSQLASTRPKSIVYSMHPCIELYSIHCYINIHWI